MAHDKDPIETAQDLLALDEKDFYNLVDRDVRGRIDRKLAEFLREPIVVERWYQTLLRMKKTVEGTIAAKSSESKAQRLELMTHGTLDGSKTVDGVPFEPRMMADDIQIAFLKWRAGSIRFKVGVEERLTEVAWRRKLVAASVANNVTRMERNELAGEVARLREAIQHHQSGIDPRDATEQDEALWNVVMLDGHDEYDDYKELTKMASDLQQKVRQQQSR